jgi:type VI protein secretion system component VasK
LNLSARIDSDRRYIANIGAELATLSPGQAVSATSPKVFVRDAQATSRSQVSVILTKAAGRQAVKQSILVALAA